MPEIPDCPNALIACLRCLDDRKAQRLSLLDVRNRSSITDYLLIASGTADPHLRALVGITEKELKSQGATLVGTDFFPGSGWAVVDAFDFMVHLFIEEQRELYNLEGFWRDAPRLDVEALLDPTSPKA
jgi:ribosome-associated protein